MRTLKIPGSSRVGLGRPDRVGVSGDEGQSEYVAGIVHFGADPGLMACLASLLAQRDPPQQVIVIDHDGLDHPPAEVRAKFPDLIWEGCPNRGYAAGANRVLKRALSVCPAAEFVLILNPDIALAPDFMRHLLLEFGKNPKAVIAGGKQLRPGERLLDSAGIEMHRSRRFRDRGSEQPDEGQFDDVECVAAVSGAALCLRTAALGELEVGGEVFDEDFFSYHEDTDLAWRARRLGFSVVYVPKARAIHARGWKREARKSIPPSIRRHSFKNRYLEMIKNERVGAFLRDLPVILVMEIARAFFALFADRAVLPGYLDAARASKTAWTKRRIIRNRIAQIRS